MTAKLAVFSVVIVAISALAALAVFFGIENEEGASLDDEALEKLILQNYSDFGFSRIESVVLKNCELKIEVNLDRTCPPSGTVTGMFDHKTIIIQLDELSGRMSDSSSIEGIGAEIVIWSIDSSIIDIHHRAGDLIDRFSDNHPRTVSNLSSRNETWMYTESVLNKYKIRSREISRNCSGENAFQHFNGEIWLPFRPMTANTVLTALRNYKSIRCPVPIHSN